MYSESKGGGSNTQGNMDIESLLWFDCATMPPITILLVDDVEIVRKAIRHLLETEPAIQILGEAANYKQALSMATAMRPDLVLLDLHMPDESVVEPESVKSQLGQCGSKVLAMSLSSGEHDEAARALAESFGAVGLLDKTRFGDELIPAILDSI